MVTWVFFSLSGDLHTVTGVFADINGGSHSLKDDLHSLQEGFKKSPEPVA